MAKCLLFAVLASSAAASGPVVKVAQGTLQGGADGKGWLTFRNVPFAAPPVGDLRWRPPQPPAPYSSGSGGGSSSSSSPRDATQFGHTCLQPGIQRGNVTTGLWPSIGGVGNASEDCLTVNIVVPDTSRLNSASNAASALLLPVFVYIPSGEFHYGAANDAESNFPGFARRARDAILVTVNYRVGIFGFLASEDFRARDAGPSATGGVTAGGSAGNYGLQDQRAAMAWVKANIAAFGGDAERITIWGESSGATSVAAHLAYPLSRGLFRRAIMESSDFVETKPWADAVTQHAYLLSFMAVMNGVFGANCQLRSGGAGAAWVPVRGAVMDHAAARSIWNPRGGPPNATLAAARAWCGAVAGCLAVTAPVDAAALPPPATVVGGLKYVVLTAAQLKDVGTVAEAYKVETNYVTGATVWVRAAVLGPTGTRCLLDQDASTLLALDNDGSALYPYRDSFIGSTWAPAIDGVEADRGLEEMLAKAKPGDEQVIVGFNRDEGSIFMGGLPGPLPSNTTDGELTWWASQLWGAAGGAAVLPLYETLVPPLDTVGPYTGNLNYWRAVRMAGDWGMGCTARRAARALASAGHDVYLYFFDHTPVWSVNYGAGAPIGAYHGAEVPYVFNDDFELDHDAGGAPLSSTLERDLSAAMTCLWLNFGASGDPNVGGACDAVGSFSGDKAAEAAVPQWTRYAVQGGTFSNASMHFGTSGEGGVFVQTDLNGRQPRCDLFDTLTKPFAP